MTLIDKQKNKTEAAVEEFYEFKECRDFLLGENYKSSGAEGRIRHNVIDDRRTTAVLAEFDEDFEKVQEEAAAALKQAHEQLHSKHRRINELRDQIESALKELSELGVDVAVYLKQLLIGFEATANRQNDRTHRSIICTAIAIMLISLICIIAKQVQRLRASNDSENVWNGLNQLLSRNHAEIRMVDLRRIINKYQDELGHIKTAGRGRTKIKIIGDLRAFQNANVVQ